MIDSNVSTMTSNKPYLVGAFYDWISDNDLTPYIVVDVNVYGVLVPMSYVADGQIVLNIAGSAVGAINMGESAIEFSARFGGKLEHITVPYGAIGAIYAKENGAGTSLPIEHPTDDDVESPVTESSAETVKTGLSSVTAVDCEKDKSGIPKVKSKASLKIIK
jgi:stringent starvation protein B